MRGQCRSLLLAEDININISQGGWLIYSGGTLRIFVGVFLPHALTVVLRARHYSPISVGRDTHATNVVEEMDRRCRSRRRVGGKFSDRAAATSAAACARKPRLGAEGAARQEPQPRG